MVLLATIALNVYLYIRVPKGFFPQQDNGRLMGAIQADQDTSFQAMNRTLLPMVKIVAADPAVDTVIGFTGGGTDGHGPHVRLAQAARRPRRLGRRRHHPAAAEAGPGAGGDALPAGRAGHARRRADEQRAVPVHHAGRQPRGPDEVRARHAQRAAQGAAHRRREQRPAEHGACRRFVDYDRETAARFGISPQLDRHHAVRRLRPAAGVHDVHDAQPVPRGDGGGAGVLAEPADAARHLRPVPGRIDGAARARSRATRRPPRRWP